MVKIFFAKDKFLSKMYKFYILNRRKI